VIVQAEVSTPLSGASLFDRYLTLLCDRRPTLAAKKRGGREPGRQLRLLSFIARIHAMTFLELHILATSAGALAHYWMLPVHMVMHPNHLAQAFCWELRAWDGECSGLCQCRNCDGNSQNQAPTQRRPD
jgi:hypothetical protein